MPRFLRPATSPPFAPPSIVPSQWEQLDNTPIENTVANNIAESTMMSTEPTDFDKPTNRSNNDPNGKTTTAPYDGFIARKAEDIVGMIGHIEAEQLHIAVELIDAIPQELLDAVHRPESAAGIVYVLLLNKNPDDRRKQLAVLAEHSRPEIFDLVVQWIDPLNTFAPQSRLPLIQMALPSLKLLSHEDYMTFRRNVNRLTKADERLDLFEYTVQALLLRPLDVHFGLAQPHRIRFYNIKDIRQSLETVLSHLAWAGQDDQTTVERAFEVATKNIGVKLSLLPKGKFGAADWDAALKQLLEVDPTIKRRILCCMVECICFDGRITAREGELLRAICAAMDCPMPPLGTAHNRTDLYQLGEEV